MNGKKILIAGFMALIMLLVPLTTAVGNAGVFGTNNGEQKNASLTIKLTTKELSQTYANLKNLFKKDYPKLYQIVLQAFNNAITRDRNGVIKLDLEKLKSGITPKTSYELQMLQQITGTSTKSTGINVLSRDESIPKQTVGSSILATLYRSGGVGYVLSAVKQKAVAVPIVNDDIQFDELIENYSKNLWENTVRPFLGEDVYPAWRTDNNDWDGDGPNLTDEKSNKKDETQGNPSIKYLYQGLDDYMDWNCNSAFLFVISASTLALVLCLLMLILVVGLVGLISVLLAYITSGCLFLEAFDFKDLPYRYPNSGWDGL